MSRRRLLIWLTSLLVIPVLLAGALLAALWWWTATDTSLSTALQQASRYLPAGQSLMTEDVRGTLRQGGHIGLLRWEKNGLIVEARQINLVWQPTALLDRRLQLDTLHIAQLRIDDPSPATGTAPLDNLVLPFQVDLRFAVDALRWAGGGKLQATGLSGRYRFDQVRHTIKLEGITLAAGQYRAQASLLARAPLTLDAQVQGDVQATVPGSTKPLALAATASARGNLAGLDALLDLHAQVRPATSVTSTAQPMQATLVAQISPWATQPIAQANATFNQLDLATLWPDAPHTLLTGNATVQPDASSPAWQAQGSFTNRLSGPWNQARLPVEAAQARFAFSNGQWLVQSLTADGSGGHVVVQGRVTGPSGWQAQATLQNINPAALHTQLAAARVDGQVSASAEHKAIEFDTRLQASAKQPDASRLQGLHLKNASAKGRWVDGLLSLQTLQVQTSDALLQGELEVQIASKASRGKLMLTLPGGQAQIQGQIGAKAGGGDFALRVSDAAKATRWLDTLPGATLLLAGHSAQGHGVLTGTWTGGWQGTGLAVQSKLHVPQMDVTNSTQTANQVLGVRELRVDLSGSLSALALKTSGQLQVGTHQFTLQAQATGGRSSTIAGWGDNWQAVVSSARLQAQENLQPGTWTAQIRQPVSLVWKRTPTGSVLETSAGESTLTGPDLGVATVLWRPVRWSHTGTRHELQTQGQLQGIPMGWLDLLGSTQLTHTGLRGDLVFDGDWDVLAVDTLKLKASLVRRSGDIVVQTEGNSEGNSGGAISAGVKDARVTLTVDGDALRASVRWDSERAGIAQGEVSTRISAGGATGGGGWRWPADAPLTGSLRAQLPQVGVWSVLAPAGWRIRGTLDASVALAGTRQAPQWSGTLNADSLALRSIADGIEFSNGKLRTTLNGQRLDIHEFSLQGATGGGAGVAGGGTLSAKGFAQWQADGGLGGAVGASSLSKIRVELNAQAQALRVTARADRRLAVSGSLQAKLMETKLEVRGTLRADQALFILPDENTPSLGTDVVVKSSVKSAATPTTPSVKGSNATQQPIGVHIAPDVAVTLDMGPDFRVQGRGLNTRLAGSLQLASSGATSGIPRLTGNLNTVGGSYKAYGQQLDIEEGVLRFTGPYDNPALDILAIRPNLTQRVGVQISGTALLPRIRLYADPELPDAEKLAWLVLGRSAANGGAESAVLQQAALALLGGNGKGLSGGLAEALGLDELSFRGSASNADGTTSAAAVTLGKRLSRNFYVAYERSVAGTLGTVYIFYDLSKRLTLRAQTGEQSAIDLIFTVPYD